MLKKIALAGLAAVVVTPAYAHVGHDHAFALADGLAHPFAGIDHLAAMVTVGLWAALAGGRRVWAWPLAFLAMMAVGAVAGRAGVALPWVEPAIAASLVVLGLATLLAVRAPASLGAVAIAAFALFHGHAHGVEATGGTFAGFLAGMLVATALLHAAGIALGSGLERWTGRWPVRTLGAATSALGLVLFVS